MGDLAGRAHRRAQATTGGRAGCPARLDRNPATHRPGVRRRRRVQHRTRSFTVKPIHLISALVLALSLAACGGESRSEEHTSELQSLMRNSYAVFCLKKKTKLQHP